MRRTRSRAELFEDGDASAVESFLQILGMIAAMAVAAAVCSGIVTLSVLV